MTLAQERPTITAIAHPLEPLTPEEIAAAVAILRQEKSLGATTRFATVTLNEPAKETVLGFRPGDAILREAFAIILDPHPGQGHLLETYSRCTAADHAG